MALYNRIQKIILAVIIVLGLVLMLTDRIPQLPSTKTDLETIHNVTVLRYLQENLFAIVFSILALFIGIFTLIYGVYIYHRINYRDVLSKSNVALGIFIMLSGIWVLTDSRILDAFTTDFGSIFSNNVSFLSYISFMLLPIVFIEFLRNLHSKIRGITVINTLFLLNLTVFVVLIVFQTPKAVYFISLLVHHVLMYALMILVTVRHARDVFSAKDKQKQNIARGVMLFMLFAAIAILFFLFNSKRLYAIIYGIGFAILILYMIKITIYNMLSIYKENVKLELYKSLSYTDVLTGIKNRNAFINDQENLRINENVCFIMIDVNGLKQVNDTLGHHFGDDMIRRAAQIANDSFSDIGACYRIGGDEFAVICQNINEAVVKKAVSKMKREIEKVNAQNELKISLACGYAFGGRGIADTAALFAAADKAMYSNKKEMAFTRANNES